jgi:hypothetical protein
VNKFLGEIITERNKVPSTTHQQENPQAKTKQNKKKQERNSEKEVFAIITCQAEERFAFTKRLSAAKLFNPSPLFSKKIQITFAFHPPNLTKSLRLALSSVKKG